MSYSPWRYKITKPPALGRAATLAARIVDAADVVVQPMEWRDSGKRPGGSPDAGGKTQPAPPPEAENESATRAWQQRVEDARAAGRRDGEAAGRAQAAAELQPVIERSARAVSEMAAYKPALRKQAEADTVRLALAIAHRVLRREIAADPEALRGLVLAALEKLQSQEISRVKAHPAQSAQIAACLKNAAPNLRIEVVPEPSLQPGGLVFETNHGNLDASVDSQLQEIERGLTDRLQRAR
jgi:flagellar assembly protein FliH